MRSIKGFLAGTSDSGYETTLTLTLWKKKKQLLLTLLAALLLIAAVIGVVTGVKSRNNNSKAASIHQVSTAHAIVKSSCSSTLYPDLCFSTLANIPELAKSVTSQKDVIILSLNRTTIDVQSNNLGIKKLLARRKAFTERQKTALNDCLETIVETLYNLHQAVKDLEEYPSKKSLTEHADDLKTLVSAAMTYQETCLDGFSHDKADRLVRNGLQKGQVLVEKLCSNALAMIKNLTDADMANEMELAGGRKLKELDENESGWPEWLSAGDRRLLQSSTVTPDVVVAADGSGNFRSVSEAVAAAPQRSSRRYVIRIKAGVYRENVEVPSNKPNIMFVGDGRINTIITASLNVVDGSTTFRSATVAAVGESFLARDITFQNAAGPSKHQAVAIRVGSDLSAFYRCGMIAYQDTLYVHTNRQFYANCYIAGTIDFIFGNGAASFQHCDIRARRPNPGQKNMVTAQGRTDPNQNTGIVIQKCNIDATSDLRPVLSDFPTYLGRPWKEYSRTVVMQSTVTDVINPAGWYEWDGNFALDTLFYGEYRNTGAGADTSRRVTWRGFKVITSASEAEAYTPGRFIDGGNWLPSTGFPYSLGL
ncbi:hypothetical protein ACH5RR_024274 [Cinchona calisaya]|uniref:Pectinesterase n=1 Tax=Cinchona calisaya TaxID=153742 RepID=A0ABD2YW75_9GENT